jgi:hypothetical protein
MIGILLRGRVITLSSCSIPVRFEDCGRDKSKRFRAKVRRLFMKTTMSFIRILNITAATAISVHAQTPPVINRLIIQEKKT